MEHNHTYTSISISTSTSISIWFLVAFSWVLFGFLLGYNWVFAWSMLEAYLEYYFIKPLSFKSFTAFSRFALNSGESKIC